MPPEQPQVYVAALLLLVVCVTPAGGQMQTLLLEFEDTVASGMGRAVCGAGDVDGDGHDDIALGEPLVDEPFENGGRVTIRSGKTGDVLLTLHGFAEEASFGRAVAPAGDIDGDGIPDLAVGAPGTSENGPGSGSVRICSGADGSTLLVLLGQAAGEHLGLSVACARDLDGQPGPDIVASTAWGSTNGTDNGSVRAFSGQTGALLYTLSAGVPGEWFGESLAIAGDVDADGNPDLAIGAKHAVRVYSGFKSPWWQYFAYDLWSTTWPPSRPVLAGGGTMIR